MFSAVSIVVWIETVLELSTEPTELRTISSIDHRFRRKFKENKQNKNQKVLLIISGDGDAPKDDGDDT